MMIVMFFGQNKFISKTNLQIALQGEFVGMKARRN